MGVTSGNVWNADPRLLMIVELCHEEKGVLIFEKVSGICCVIAPVVFSIFVVHENLCLFNVGEYWMTSSVVCTSADLRRSNVSNKRVHLVLNNLWHSQPLQTECCIVLWWPNFDSLMWLKECISAFDLVDLFLLDSPFHTYVNTTTCRESLLPERDVKGSQFLWYCFLTQHQTQCSHQILCCLIFVV